MKEHIDHYKILKSVNKGGMGEVFLVYDPLCKREVALKQILPHLKHHQIIKERFLREAEIAARLTHPSIIPILSIDPKADKEYYTMPYIEGETLKCILKQCIEEERREGQARHPIGASIPALSRIFLSLCEAIAYAHSQGIVHRDLKPDNIIIGRYGQVILIDWGLADRMGSTDPQPLPWEEADYKDLTRPGKVPGTLNYIAPERICGGASTIGVDIYSLGVILYQLLTLRTPFQRSSVNAYKKGGHLEEYIEPVERAPYRDIPQHLNDITTRCLKKDPAERFSKVDDLIEEIKSFLEGRPEWIASSLLSPALPQDWEFQEHIFLSSHHAISRSPDVMQWVHLMISKKGFSGNTRIETRFKLHKNTQGVGLLLHVPSKEERNNFFEGICLFLCSQTRLMHNQIEVMTLPGAYVQDEQWHSLCIEKVDHQVTIFFDGKKAGHYISRSPLPGTHLGILSYDTHFSLEPLKISGSSRNMLVSCLAIPDAFFADKQFQKARIEYENIAQSFSGRMEGREAWFRSALTLIEEAKLRSSSEQRELLWLAALDKFGQLRHTPGAPLEYLGKSLVYKASGEIEEEIKCLELSLRKYKNHPLLYLIKEQVIFRLYETTSSDRIAAYHFALLALRHLPSLCCAPEHAQLFASLQKHLEKSPLFLFNEEEEEQLACELCLWLGKPIPLVEIVETSSSSSIIANALFALLMLAKEEWVEENLHYLKEEQDLYLVRCALNYFKKGPLAALQELETYKSSYPESKVLRCAYFLFYRALLDRKTQGLLPHFSHFASVPFLDALHLLYCVQENALSEAQRILSSYPDTFLHDEYSLLFFPMGCYLFCTENEEIARSHFSSAIELPCPPTSMLLSYFLQRGIDAHSTWFTKRALYFEKVSFWLQLMIYYHCVDKSAEVEDCFRELQQHLNI